MSIAALDALAAHLATTLTDPHWIFNAADASIFVGPDRPAGDGIPNRSIHLVITGGVPSTVFKNGDGLLRALNIQIRNKSKNYSQSLADAYAIFEAVEHNPPAGYVECSIEHAAPLRWVSPDQGHHQHTTNATLLMREA